MTSDHTADNNVQPVAWQQRLSDGRWGTIFHGNDKPIGEARPLYDHPPMQPDVELDVLVERLHKLARNMKCDAQYEWDEDKDVLAAARIITTLRTQPDWKAMAEWLEKALRRVRDYEGDRWSDDLDDKITMRDIARAALSDLTKMKEKP